MSDLPPFQPGRYEDMEGDVFEAEVYVGGGMVEGCWDWSAETIELPWRKVAGWTRLNTESTQYGSA